MPLPGLHDRPDQRFRLLARHPHRAGNAADTASAGSESYALLTGDEHLPRGACRREPPTSAWPPRGHCAGRVSWTRRMSLILVRPFSQARLTKTNSPVTVHWVTGCNPPRTQSSSAGLEGLCLTRASAYRRPSEGMLSRVRDATGVMLRRRFREFDEDADPRRPAARRPLAEASALAAARELVPPDSTAGLVLPIAHLRLNEPERVTIACSRHARQYASLATSKRCWLGLRDCYYGAPGRAQSLTNCANLPWRPQELSLLVWIAWSSV